MKKEEASLKPKLYDGLLVLDAAGQPVRQNRSLVQTLSDLPRENGQDRIAALLAEPSVQDAIAKARDQGDGPTVELVDPAWWRDHTVAVTAMKHGDEILVGVHNWTPVYKLSNMQQDFVVNVSHELRTPLTAIRMAAEPLHMGAMRDDRMRATDFPGSDWETLVASIRMLVDTLPADTVVYPGHGPITTLGAELAQNPFLAEVRAERAG